MEKQKSSGFNWGKGIAIAMTLFIGFIVYMVVGFFAHPVDLESDDYYQKEIAFEDEISALKNANELKHPPVVLTNETHFVVQFHPDHEFTDAVVHLKRPNDENEDKAFPIENTTFFTVSKEELQNGVYNIELSYVSSGKNCLQKETVYI